MAVLDPRKNDKDVSAGVPAATIPFTANSVSQGRPALVCTGWRTNLTAGRCMVL